MIDREKVKKGLDLCLTGEAACKDCPYDAECKEARGIGPSPLRRDALELLKHDEQTIESLERTIDKLTKSIAEQWHPFDPMQPNRTGLKDHDFYLVTVKGFGTPMKAMYHIDMPFGFLPPPTKEFDPYDVIAWRELPDNMDEEVEQDDSV